MSTVPVLKAIRARLLAAVPEGSAAHSVDGIFDMTESIRRSTFGIRINDEFNMPGIDHSRGEAAILLSRYVALGESGQIRAMFDQRLPRELISSEGPVTMRTRKLEVREPPPEFLEDPFAGGHDPLDTPYYYPDPDLKGFAVDIALGSPDQVRSGYMQYVNGRMLIDMKYSADANLSLSDKRNLSDQFLTGMKDAVGDLGFTEMQYFSRAEIFPATSAAQRGAKWDGATPVGTIRRGFVNSILNMPDEDADRVWNLERRLLNPTDKWSQPEEILRMEFDHPDLLPAGSEGVKGRGILADINNVPNAADIMLVESIPPVQRLG